MRCAGAANIPTRARKPMRADRRAQRDAFLTAIRSGPVVMGILNVTPDSFSDGGLFLNADAALARAAAMAAEGCGIIDVGGESTRPAAAPVSEADEIDRIVPLLQQLAAKIEIPLSIDTYK